MSVTPIIIHRTRRVFGNIVHLEPSDFMNIVKKEESPLIVEGKGGLFTTYYQYMTSYKGLVFYAKSKTPLVFTNAVEIIKAQKMYVMS